MASKHEPSPGGMLYDMEKRLVGSFQDRSGPYLLLRPLKGGREWEAKPNRVRPAASEGHEQHQSPAPVGMTHVSPADKCPHGGGATRRTYEGGDISKGRPEGTRPSNAIDDKDDKNSAKQADDKKKIADKMRDKLQGK